MFTAVLPTTVKRLIQPKCLLIAEWINEMLYIHNGILFNLEEKGNSETCYEMDEPWRCYTKWNKPVRKVHILYDSTYIGT